MSKYWAYKTQFGNEIVLANQIEHEKVALGLTGGRWKSPRYFSAGAVGRRKTVFQRSNPGGRGGHFYFESEGSGGGGGGGETLSHELCKRAISELARTTLKFGSREVPMRILKCVTEQEVVIGNKRYRPDVSLWFESENDYQMKWGGVLHIEVWHTHPTEREKSADFFNSGLAIFEMRVTEKLQFPVEEKFATPVLIERHVKHLKELFSNWIGGRMLSDPKSRDYLLKENSYLYKSIEQMKSEKAALEQALDKAQGDSLMLRQSLETERRRRAEMQVELKKWAHLLALEEQKIKQLDLEKIQLNEAAELVQVSLHRWKLALVAVVAVLLMLLYVLLA